MTLPEAARKVRWLMLAGVVFLLGCQTPTSRIHEYADRQGFARSSVQANGFKLMLIHRTTLPPAADDVLHVYLEGDGSPWKFRRVVMPDPTPRRPLMLQLMRLDPAPSMYLGRPCYNGESLSKGCDARLWTSARYSTVVVDSMAAALQRVIEENGVTRLRLFGHSGGGTLAMLLAARVPNVEDIVTIAGNLDTDAWTSLHGYTPLFSSLNPAKQEALPETINQWHLLGGQDAVIPPGLTRSFIERQPRAVAVSVGGFGHGCCWDDVWPDILDGVANNAPGRLPGVRFR